MILPSSFVSFLALAALVAANPIVVRQVLPSESDSVPVSAPTDLPVPSGSVPGPFPSGGPFSGSLPFPSGTGAFPAPSGSCRPHGRDGRGGQGGNVSGAPSGLPSGSAGGFPHPTGSFSHSHAFPSGASDFPSPSGAPDDGCAGPNGGFPGGAFSSGDFPVPTGGLGSFSSGDIPTPTGLPSDASALPSDPVAVIATGFAGNGQ